MHVATAEFTALAKEYKQYGCELSLAKLRDDCEFVAPAHLHTKILDEIKVLADVKETSFQITDPGFDVLVAQQSHRLLALVKSKCYLDKKIDIFRTYIPVPRARGIDYEQTIKQSQQTASAMASPDGKTVIIGHSTVRVIIGDLATQSVSLSTMRGARENMFE